MCGSIPPVAGNHSDGKEPGPILAALGALILVGVFLVALIASWLRRRG